MRHAHITEKVFHLVKAALVADGSLHHLHQRARTGNAHQRPRGNQVGVVERRDAQLFGFLHHRRGADGELRLVLVHGSQVLFQRGAKLHLHTFGTQPVSVVLVPGGGRTSRAHITQICAALDQQTAHEQLRALVSAQGDAALDGLGGQHAAHGRQGLVARGVDLGLRHTAGIANGLQPVIRAFHAHGGRANDGPACGLELAHRGGVERVDRSDADTVQGRIQLAPLAGRNYGPGNQVHGCQHLADDDRVGREHLTQQGHSRFVQAATTGRLHRAVHDFSAGVLEHGAAEHILGLGVGRYTKTGHINTNDAHTVDLFGQQLQRHAAGGGDTQVDDHDGIELRRVCLGVHRLADVFEQLAGDQGLGAEGYIAHTAARTVKMRCESQSVDAAGRARQNSLRAAHAQAHAQRTEGRAHALRLVMRTGVLVARVILGVLLQHLGFACGLGCCQQGFAPAVAAHAIALERGGHRALRWRDMDRNGLGIGHGFSRLRLRRRPLPKWA